MRELARTRGVDSRDRGRFRRGAPAAGRQRRRGGGHAGARVRARRAGRAGRDPARAPPGGRVLLLDTDWDSVVWHSGDPDRTRAVLAAWEEHLADPYLPRTLGGTLRAAGFVEVAPSVWPLFNAGAARDTFSAALVPVIAAFVVGRRGVTEETAQGWVRRPRRARRGDVLQHQPVPLPRSGPGRALTREAHTDAGTVGPVARRFGRRWLLVGAGAAALVGVSAVRVPAAPVTADPAALRARIRAGVPPYVGYAESTGQLGLPQIPQLESTVALLTGTTRIRAYVGSADAWRADELTPTGEHGVYRVGPSEFLWDFEANQLTRVLGIAAARLPRASDLLPPDLARRLLALAGNDPVAALPSRRIAGRDAAGLRVTPTDPQTTVGSVDIWADPATALPLRVEVAGRTGPPLLSTELLEVVDGPPDPALLRPLAPPGAGAVTAEVVDVAGALQGPERAPAAAHARRPAPGRAAGHAAAGGRGVRHRAGRVRARAHQPRHRRARRRFGRRRGRGRRPGAVGSRGPRLHAAAVGGGATRGRSGSLLLGAVDPTVLDAGDRPAARAATGMTVIETEGLTKRFRHVVAVDGVSLTVPTGARFGLLGPNGSGKTTLVRMLLGLVHPTAGRVALLGRADAAGRPARAAAGRGAGGGARGVAAAVGADQPAADGRGRWRRPPGPRRPGGGGAGARRPRRHRRTPRAGVLAGDAPTARHRRRAPAQARAAPPRRAHQRPRPPRHRRDARAAAALRGAGHDRGAVQPPAERGGGALHRRWA